MYAEDRRSLLIVLQGRDAAGKDGTIRHVFGPMNPQGTRVTSFKVPSKEEMAHDFLWRCHRAAPKTGMVGIFNRSHYEDVLVVRVHDLVPKKIWSKRYDHINAFERLLADKGTVILKFYLHIDRDEQLERFKKRMENPRKNWKISDADYAERPYWDAYTEAFEDALSKCSTDIRAVVHHSGQLQMGAQPGHRRHRGRHDEGTRHALSGARGRYGRDSSEVPRGGKGWVVPTRRAPPVSTSLLSTR